MGLAVWLLCLSLLLCACSQSAADVPELVEPVQMAMATVTVGYGDVFNLDYAAGSVLPYSEEILFPVDGALGSIEVVPGQMVKKGDVLARMDVETMQEQLTEMKEALETAQSIGEMDITRLTLAYQQCKVEQAQLEASPNATSYALELMEIDVWEAWQAVEHAEQTLELELRNQQNEVARLEEELEQYSEILAPFDGMVTWVEMAYKKGDQLAEETPILALSDVNDLYIATTRVSDSFRDRCDRIYAQIGTEEYDLSMREVDQEEALRDVANHVYTTSKFDFVDDVKLNLEERSSVLVYFRSNYRENVLCLPSEVVYKDSDGYYVYLMENDEKVRTAVEIGVKTDLRTEILSGLEEGDVVYAEN